MMQALLQNRPLLFLDHMHAAEVPDKIITIFVRCCVYLAFFGPQPTICQQVNHLSFSVTDLSSSVPMSLLFVSENDLMKSLLEQNLQNDDHVSFNNQLQESVAATLSVNPGNQEALWMNLAAEQNHMTAENAHLQDMAEDMTQQTQEREERAA